MSKKRKSALMVLIAICATLTVFKFGVKKGVDSSLQPTEQNSQSNHVKTPTEIETSKNQNSASDNTPQNDIAGTNGPAAGTSGSASSVNDHTSSTSQVPGEVKKIAPENNCFAFEYRHTQDAQAKDIEEFLDYSNAFPVLHANLNANSVCVKVNQKPVAFKLIKNKAQDEVMIGAVVGPESVIRVSYCVGKVACKEACAVKSNRFMDDMMSDAGEEDEFKDSWGEESAAHTAQKKELKGKVKELRSVASENKDLAQRSVIRTWNTLQKQEWVCKK